VHELDTLFTLGEVAIGMAGFSAIVVLFKRGDSGRWRADDADRFNGMLIHAMAAAFFCVLPAFLAVLIDAPSRLWVVGSALLGTQIALHTGIVLRLPSTQGPARAVVRRQGWYHDAAGNRGGEGNKVQAQNDPGTHPHRCLRRPCRVHPCLRRHVRRRSGGSVRDCG